MNPVLCQLSYLDVWLRSRGFAPVLPAYEAGEILNLPPAMVPAAGLEPAITSLQVRCLTIGLSRQILDTVLSKMVRLVLTFAVTAVSWWEYLDLNQEPLAYQASALTS